MLPRLHGTLIEIGARGCTTKCACQSYRLSREALHSMGRWLNSQLLRFLPANVDEQTGVRRARLHHDRAQMSLIKPYTQINLPPSPSHWNIQFN